LFVEGETRTKGRERTAGPNAQAGKPPGVDLWERWGLQDLYLKGKPKWGKEQGPARNEKKLGKSSDRREFREGGKTESTIGMKGDAESFR